jgi:hypothetical protein
VDDWTLEQLMAFDPGAAELEGGGDDEPDAEEEEDGPPVVVELVPPMVIGRQPHPGRQAKSVDGTPGNYPAQGCTASWSKASLWTTRTSSA